MGPGTIRKIIGFALATLLLAPAAASASGGGSREAQGTEICQQIPITLPGFTVQVGGTNVRVGEKRDVKACVFAEATVGANPQMRRFNDCGPQCMRIEVSDVGVAEQIRVIITYLDDGKPEMVTLEPPVVKHTILPGRFLCVGTGTPDPCVDRITAPSELSGKATKGQIALAWGASEDTDGSELGGYEIWRSLDGTEGSFALLATSSAASFNDTDVTSGERYWYYVVAYDADGNHSGASNTLTLKAR